MNVVSFGATAKAGTSACFRRRPPTLGVAKPNPSVFEHALSELGTRKDLAVMVGDSIPKDVDGAIAAGLRAVWVNRSGSSAATARDDLVEISTLSDLPDLLDGLG